jgi:hypothetical protein
MSERAPIPAETQPLSGATDFGDMVSRENLRRALRQTPQERLDMLCAALSDAEQRGMIPKRDRAAHEQRLLWLIQRKSSSN